MNGPDVSGLDPARAPEVLRRIAAIKAYTAGRRTAADREEAAGRLGITPGQFLRLVRAWRETGDAARIFGAGRPAGTPRASRRMTEPVRRAVDDAIAQLGAAAGIAVVTSNVAARCAALGVAPPSLSTVERHLQRARGSTGGSGRMEERGVVVARCDLRVPMIEGGRLVEPAALVAALSPSGLIAGTSLDGPDGGLARLLIDVGRLADGSADPPMTVHATLADNGARSPELAGPAVRWSSGARLELARLLGDRIGSIQIGFGDTSEARLGRKVRSRLNSALRRDQVEAALEQAVRLHNATRSDAETPADRAADPQSG